LPKSIAAVPEIFRQCINISEKNKINISSSLDHYGQLVFLEKIAPPFTLKCSSCSFNESLNTVVYWYYLEKGRENEVWQRT